MRLAISSRRLATLSLSTSFSLDLMTMNNNDQKLTHPSDKQLFGFGAIIWQSAALESLMHFAIAGLLGIGIEKSLFITTPMGFNQKRDLWRVLTDSADVPGHLNEKMNDFIQRTEAIQGLRNHVAHSTWTKGARPDSIKPMQLKARGTVKILGLDEKERDYTAADLYSEYEKIRLIGQELEEFLVEQGLK